MIKRLFSLSIMCLCVVCGCDAQSSNGGNKKWLSQYYGLLPQGKKLVVQKGHDNNYYTENNILFTAEKNKWNLNPHKCFGVLIHKACWDIINTGFGVELKLEMLSPFVSSTTNLLRNIEYWNQDSPDNEISLTNPLKKSDKGVVNKQRIISIWINFYNYQKNTYQRQQYYNRIKRTRYNSFHTRQMPNSRLNQNPSSVQRLVVQPKSSANNRYTHPNVTQKSSSVNKLEIFKKKILTSLT